MSKQLLKETIQQLFAGNIGLLAMDESNGTCNKGFEMIIHKKQIPLNKFQTLCMKVMIMIILS